MEFERMVKPPLGVIPKSQWIESRVGDLARAILRQIESDNPDKDLLIMWAEELRDHCSGLARVKP